MAEPRPAPTSRAGQRKVNNARREVERIRRRVEWRCSRLEAWRPRWSWRWAVEAVRATQADGARLFEVVETWWPETVGAERAWWDAQVELVNASMARLTAERRFLMLSVDPPLDT